VTRQRLPAGSELEPFAIYIAKTAKGGSVLCVSLDPRFEFFSRGSRISRSGFSFQHVSLSAFGFVWSVVLQSRGSISAFQFFSFCFAGFRSQLSAFELRFVLLIQVSGFKSQLLLSSLLCAKKI